MADQELMYSMEISDDQSVSKMSNSHMDLKDDNKSMKSFKSRGSIRSELPNAGFHNPEDKKDIKKNSQQRNVENSVRPSKKQQRSIGIQDDSEDESDYSDNDVDKEPVDIISHKSYKSIKSMQQKNKGQGTYIGQLKNDLGIRNDDFELSAIKKEYNRDSFAIKKTNSGILEPNLSPKMSQK
jgi:hypothetical protein